MYRPASLPEHGWPGDRGVAKRGQLPLDPVVVAVGFDEHVADAHDGSFFVRDHDLGQHHPMMDSDPLMPQVHFGVTTATAWPLSSSPWRCGQMRRLPTPRPGVTAAATTAVLATGDGPGLTAFATTAVLATGWPMTPTRPTRAALTGISGSYRRIGLDRGDDCLHGHPSVGDQLAAGAAR